MRFILALMAFAALVISGCAMQKCPETYEPVCGTDGVTYANACQAVQAGAMVAANGTCQAELCTDSDGGKDLFVKGAATDRSGSLQDKCRDALELDEAYCSGSMAATEAYPCPKGYACSLGACIKSPCQDSDGGKEQDEKGTVSAQGKSLVDECAGESRVKEYYCKDGEASYEEMQCGSGFVCVSGACSEAACTDSDKGKNTTVSGKAVKADQSGDDACVDKDTVKEYFCDGKEMKFESIDCQGGFSCDGGKCVKNVCSDSDGGKDQFVKGTATYDEKSSTDSCYSSTTVLEYFCASETSVQVEKINCGSGRECLDGKCRNVDCEENLTDLDETPQRYQIAAFDDADELVLYAGQAVEVNNELYLRLYSVGATSATFRLYEDFEAYEDNDQLCSVTIDENDSADDLCSENSGTIEVLEVDDGDDWARLSIEEYYAIEQYALEGTSSDWTENPVCPDDETTYDMFTAEFFPYLDTDSGGLNLDNKKFRLFDSLVTIRDITTDMISLEIEGDDYDLESGDEFTYDGVDYEATLTFNDGGLSKFEAEPV